MQSSCNIIIIILIIIVSLLSHPILGWLYVFSSLPSRPPPQRLLPLTSEPFDLNLRYLGQKIYRLGEMCWVTFPWPWPKVTDVASISNFFLHDEVRPAHPNTTKPRSLIALVMLITWVDFGTFLLQTVILANFILAISQEWLVQLMWNEKEVHRLDTGNDMWPLTSLMTWTVDISRSNFEIAVSQELLVWLMWNEKEAN